MLEHWDVVIVGAGPAGLFAARELALRSELRVLVLEMGPDLPARLADPGLRTSGFGGAGAFSDGKLTLSPTYGGRLARLVGTRIDELITDVDDVFLELGAPRRVHGSDPAAVAELAQRASAAGMTLLPAKIRHIGTDHLPALLERLRGQLPPERVRIRTGVAAEHLAAEHGRLLGVIADGHLIAAPNVLIAPGRAGADWVDAEATRLRIPASRNLVDIGLRVECHARILAPLTDPLYEFKLRYRSPTFGDGVRTFCVCPHGEVALEPYDDVVTINGHSNAARRTANTNFAVLVTTRFTEPFHQPIAYGRHVARLANMLGGTAIVQRLGDLLAGRRSTPERIARGAVRPTLAQATPGDLAFVLPYRYLTDILQLLQAIDTLAPGLWADDTLLYGVEAKFYSAELRLSPQLETPIPGLYGAGDGAGVSRGLVQAAASGIVAARAITAYSRRPQGAGSARRSRPAGASAGRSAPERPSAGRENAGPSALATPPDHTHAQDGGARRSRAGGSHDGLHVQPRTTRQVHPISVDRAAPGAAWALDGRRPDHRRAGSGDLGG
ncbi:MAG TPA: NAD(P)-binding protein [Actinomycetes bacterium]|nr:NAD(P)-binding protein [Actinomycetes bacterium]